MAILQKTYKTDRPVSKARRISKTRVIQFTVYLDPKFDRKVRAFANKNDMTLTQMANRALTLFMEQDSMNR